MLRCFETQMHLCDALQWHQGTVLQNKPAMEPHPSDMLFFDHWCGGMPSSFHTTRIAVACSVSSERSVSCYALRLHPVLRRSFCLQQLTSAKHRHCVCCVQVPFSLSYPFRLAHKHDAATPFTVSPLGTTESDMSSMAQGLQGAACANRRKARAARARASIRANR